MNQTTVIINMLSYRKKLPKHLLESIVGHLQKEILRFMYFTIHALHGAKVSAKIVKCTPAKVNTSARELGNSDGVDNRDGTY